MPVNDEFVIAPDFFGCPFCNKTYPDTECMDVLFRLKDTEITDGEHRFVRRLVGSLSGLMIARLLLGVNCQSLRSRKWNK